MTGTGEGALSSFQSAVRTLASITAPVRDLTRVGADSLLAALLAALSGCSHREQASNSEGAARYPETDKTLSIGAAITNNLLAGDGRYTQAETADQVGMPLDDVCRLWRSAGFAEVGDEQRVFTTADIAALKDVSGLVEAGILDVEGAVILARPFGHLLSRLATVQTALLSEVLGKRIAAGQVPDDPLLSERMSTEAVRITRELLPVLERLTLSVWRRHLATEAGRALLPATDPDATSGELAAVGFIDMSGFTGISRGLDTIELAAMLEQFEACVLDTALAHGGRVIKNLGDEAMFVADDAAAAAEIALVVVDEIASDARAPAVHAGLALGPVLFRSGDMFGNVVNMAARITGLADRGTIRVDQAMADALDGTPKLQVVQPMTADVRGFAQLRSYRLLRLSA